jgi:hypothetical protein
MVIEVRRDDIVNKALFCLAFNMDEHSGHVLTRLPDGRRFRSSPRAVRGCNLATRCPDCPKLSGSVEYLHRRFFHR